MLYVVESQTSMATIKEEMFSKAKDIGLGILKEYNFNETLKEKGSTIKREISVFEIANPDTAQEALKLHPEFSVYLPCKISIYEENGRTVLSTIAIEDMFGSFDLDDLFKEHMGAVSNNMKKLVSSWV